MQRRYFDCQKMYLWNCYELRWFEKNKAWNYYNYGDCKIEIRLDFFNNLNTQDNWMKDRLEYIEYKIHNV